MIRDNTAEFLASLERHRRQIPFAVALALTRTAAETRDRLTVEILRVFDRPTRATQQAIYIQRATKTKPVAQVGVKNLVGRGNAAADWLRAQVLGGQRRTKRAGRAIRFSARHLKGDFVPGPGVKLDRYGNVSRAVLRRILSDLRDGPTTTKSGRARRDFYFVPEQGSHLAQRAEGVWLRKGRKVSPALLFVRETRYRRRFDFYGKGRQHAARAWPMELRKALAEAFRTAR